LGAPPQNINQAPLNLKTNWLFVFGQMVSPMHAGRRTEDAETIMIVPGTRAALALLQPT
jgi:hypothetical protein